MTEGSGTTGVDDELPAEKLPEIDPLNGLTVPLPLRDVEEAAPVMLPNDSDTPVGLVRLEITPEVNPPGSFENRLNEEEFVVEPTSSKVIGVESLR